MIPEVTSSSQQAPENTWELFLVLSLWSWEHTAITGQARGVSDYGSYSDGDGWPVGRQSPVFWDKCEAYLPCIVESPCRTEPHLSLLVSALRAHILLASFPSLPHFCSPLPVFSGVTSCTSRIMAPKRCLCPDPEACESATWHGKGTLHMWVKLTIWSWEWPELSRWTQYSH